MRDTFIGNGCLAWRQDVGLRQVRTGSGVCYIPLASLDAVPWRFSPGCCTACSVISRNVQGYLGSISCAGVYICSQAGMLASCRGLSSPRGSVRLHPTTDLYNCLQVEDECWSAGLCHHFSDIKAHFCLCVLLQANYRCTLQQLQPTTPYSSQDS